jgi:hypothetical protein
MTDMITTAAGISAGTLRGLEQGAREFFARQGSGLLAGFIRRAGGYPLPGEFAALAAPDPWREPARRDGYDKVHGTHWMAMWPGDHDC